MKFLKRLTFFYDFALRIPKRIRFVISSMGMTSLIILTTFFDFNMVWVFVPLIVIAVYFAVYFSILENINKIEWLVLFIMPLFFSIFAYFFYFLFPVRWLTRVPLIIMYGFSFYAILLTSNIFNVGVEKNLQLYRAAFSVNYLFQTFIVFLAMQVLMSFRQAFFINGLAAFLVIFPLILQLLWSVRPQVKIEREMVSYALLISFVLAQVALVLSFIPLKTTIYSLFITASYYSLSGLMYHYVDEKLFKQTIREYVFVIAFVCVIVLLTIRW